MIIQDKAKRSFFALLLALTLLNWGVGQAGAQDGSGQATISAPLDAQPLFGLVEIRGTASHPTAFVRYALEWSTAQTPDLWQPIQAPVSQQVTDGVLGQWDTVALGLPDGVYQIRLRVFLGDGQVLTDQVNGLSLQNTPPTPLPTVVPPTPLPSPPPPPDETPLPTPPSLIVQPPTLTPLPTFASPADAPPAAPPASTRERATVINFTALGNAFCNGVFFSLGLFGLILAYLVVRHVVSPRSRRVWYQIRSEFERER